jgi:ABC-type Fe3+/spermidine/putrescine transport system ATPase subunit
MLAVYSLSKSFGTRQLFTRLSLHVHSGEILALTGPSGCGKSTLLSIVAGLTRADEGTVSLDGQIIDHLPPEKRRFAMMFQDFALFPHLNARDNVAFGLVEQGVNKAAAKEQALEMLASFSLQNQAEQPVNFLSGGEKQRVALARALIIQPKVLLLDEPFSALDTQLKNSLRQEFLQRIRASSIPTLLVTHDMTEAQEMADRQISL